MNSVTGERAKAFSYVGFDLRPDGLLTCAYDLDGIRFEERFDCSADGADFTSDAARAAARLVWLLAGVSYYKAGAAPLIVVPDGLSDTERSFLADFYLHGLAEFALGAGVDLRDLVIEAPTRVSQPAVADTRPGRPLIPFGGGIDSIVVVEEIRQQQPEALLFVASTSDVPFEPIESTVAITGLPVVRARRHLDPQILASRTQGWFNGHVPVTGVLSAVAVLLAVAHGRDSVVMSNEHSASDPTDLEANGVLVNHQWSKGDAFEDGFRAVLAESLRGVDYYSALRPFSELWVSRRFVELTAYHHAFRSCNKAFYVDPALRLDHWCGRCDKCAFIDLILAPYLARDALESIFGGAEPLADPTLEPVFRSLLGDPTKSKPLECVGDPDECRRAVLIAADRPDRAGSTLLQALAADVRRDDATGASVSTEEVLLHELGPHHLPVADRP